MSLVSEALKKAQREAAAREAREKGLPPPLHSPATQPFRAKRKRGPGPAAALAIAALLVAAGLGVLLWNRAGESVTTAPAGKEEKAPDKGNTAPGASAASAQPGAGLSPTTTAPAAEGTAPPAAAASNGAMAPPAALPAPAGSTPVPVSTPDRTATAAAPAAPSMEAFQSASATAAAAPSPAARRAEAPVTPAVPPPAAAAEGGAASFVREATLADGTRIHLGGIAYSDAAPLAYLNGRLLGVGEHVESCRVARIERGQVRLDCGGRTTILTLR